MNQAQRLGLARLMLRWPHRRAGLSERFTQDPRFLEQFEAYEATSGGGGLLDKFEFARRTGACGGILRAHFSDRERH